MALEKNNLKLTSQNFKNHSKFQPTVDYLSTCECLTVIDQPHLVRQTSGKIHLVDRNFSCYTMPEVIQVSWDMLRIRDTTRSELLHKNTLRLAAVGIVNYWHKTIYLTVPEQQIPSEDQERSLPLDSPIQLIFFFHLIILSFSFVIFVAECLFATFLYDLFSKCQKTRRK